MQTFHNNQWKEMERTPCQVYTRVMWYLRPVSHYNIWKKSEFYSRKYFDQQASANSEFVRKFATMSCPCG
jgi:hypothetical protein